MLLLEKIPIYPIIGIFVSIELIRRKKMSENMNFWYTVLAIALLMMVGFSAIMYVKYTMRIKKHPVRRAQLPVPTLLHGMEYIYTSDNGAKVTFKYLGQYVSDPNTVWIEIQGERYLIDREELGGARPKNTGTLRSVVIDAQTFEEAKRKRDQERQRAN